MLWISFLVLLHLNVFSYVVSKRTDHTWSYDYGSDFSFHFDDFVDELYLMYQFRQDLLIIIELS